ncbi:MAG: di/tricarboxylate transporter [Alphaproteobacteria bacterium]|jgi:di/tricarboxylate transporter
MSGPIAASFHIWATYALVVLAIASYVTERFRAEITSLVVLVALVLLFELVPMAPLPGRQRVDTGLLLAGFANPALIAVMALLVLGQGLSRAGALDWALKVFLTITGDRKVLAIVIAFATVLIASAFVNNTPIVVIFIPILKTIARRFQLKPSAVMMPLSFAAILAGMTTLIGSSTNLLISGALVQAGEKPLGFFDFTIFGLILAAAGLIYLAVVAPKLLRQRASPMERFTAGAHRRFVAQLTVGAESKLVGETAVFNVLGINGARLILVQRNEHSYVPPFDALIIKPGDILVVMATAKALGEAQANYPHLMFNMSGEYLPEDEEERKAWLGRDQMLTEVMIAPGSQLVGRTLENIGFRARFDCLVLGLERGSRVIRRRLTGNIIREGDVLVIQGTREALDSLRTHRGIVFLDGATQPLPPARAAKMAGAIFAGTVGVAATGMLPIAAAALTGVVLMLATRVLTLRQAADALNRRIYLMVAASLGLGVAMMETGAATHLAHGIIGALGDVGPTVLLSALFLLVALLTNVLSNNATAILFTPIALSLAQGLGVNPMPFILAILFGANCSFATPIGYQTNLMVMGPGYYRFSDFLRVGGPLVLLLWLVFSAVAPWYFGL